MIFMNKKGSALMQVMVMGSIIAAIIVMLMRFAMGRTSNMLKTKRTVMAKSYAEGCIAQYNTLAMQRAMEGFPVNVNGNKETFNCKINGIEMPMDIIWGSTMTGVGYITFRVNTSELD